MSDSKKEKEVNPEEWTFDVSINTDKEGNVKEVRKPVKKSINDIQKKRMMDNLTLDDRPRETLTRRQMAEKLGEAKTEDIVICAHPIKRFLAAIVDALIVFVGYLAFKFLISPSYFLVTSFTEHYKIEFSTSQDEYKTIGLYVVACISFFIFQVISQAFYNRTIGKYFLGISIRNDESFTLKVSDVFVRELVFKPVSLLSIVGIGMCFFNKKRKMLHDILSKTIVID